MSSNGRFRTTRWTVVLRAAVEDPAGRRPAFADLYELYQRPLYVVARARGFSHDDAVDALQEFFCTLLDGRVLAEADQRRGPFRSFLLTVWRRFLTDQYRRDAAAKRGGGNTKISITVLPDAVFETMPANARDENAREEDGACVFDREWAEALLNSTRQNVLASYDERGRKTLAEALLPLLTVSMDALKCEELANQLDLSTTAIKVALHRLRARFGQALREAVLQTVDDPSEVDGEIDALLKVIH
jgi:RNA polymerase sigma factor (sigma-70 family)